MFEFLYKMTDMQLFSLLIFLSIFISLIVLGVVKRYIPLEVRYRENAVIASASALISVIYGVLAGLTALYLFNNNTYTANAVQNESNAIANVYLDSRWLHDPVRTKVQTELKRYLDLVTNVEWPLMKDGKEVGFDGDVIINDLLNYLNNFSATVTSMPNLLALRDMLQEVKSIYNSRQARLQMSFSELNPEVWEVILIGTILTLCINYLFGVNFYMHVFIVASAAVMTSSMIFLLVTLDRPFQGEFAIDPDALRSVAAFIKKNTDNPVNEAMHTHAP